MKNTLSTGLTVAKGKRFPFQTSVVCWVDLLGYGSMISEADFNPLHPNSYKARKRLKTFHEVVARESMQKFPTLVLNDGAIAYRDLSYRSASVTYDFLQRCWKLFNAICDEELSAGHPGPRMVVATGFRIKGRRGGMDSTGAQFQSLLKRVDRQEITSKQAISEARRIRPSSDIVPQLQANFAFTKAYVAESSGRRGGLGGSHCFIDLSLFENPKKLAWLELGTHVAWEDKKLRLKATFAPLLNLDLKKATTLSRRFPDGIRNGIQVAENITGDPNVIASLRRVKG